MPVTLRSPTFVTLPVCRRIIADYPPTVTGAARLGPAAAGESAGIAGVSGAHWDRCSLSAGRAQLGGRLQAAVPGRRVLACVCGGLCSSRLMGLCRNFPVLVGCAVGVQQLRRIRRPAVTTCRLLVRSCLSQQMPSAEVFGS